MRSRRLEYSETTRQALVNSAVELFTRYGYADTSLDEVAKRARVTKGALYHHFTGKRGLFEAAFAEVETKVMGRLGAILNGSDNPWESAMAGLRAYVGVCLEPAYQRIVVHEGPVVLGWERWRQAEEDFSFGVLRSAVENLVASGELDDLPVEITTRLLFGALSSAATAIATAADPHQASAEVTRSIVRVVEGLRRRPAPGATGTD